MPVQIRLNNSNLPFVLFGLAVTEANAVLLQDAGRTAPLEPFTVMAKVASTQKWVPLTDLAAVTGEALPQGIYIGDQIAAATIVAGDVTDLPIIVGEAGVDVQQLVFENSLTLGSIIGAGTIDARTVRDQLAYRSIFAEDTIYTSDFSAA